MDMEKEEPSSTQQPVGLSQVWKNLHAQLDSLFFKKIFRHVNRDRFLRLLQDEDFVNTSLPLLSSSLLNFKGVQQTFEQRTDLMADLSGLEHFIQQQKPERQLSLITQWRTLLLERAIDHLRTESAKPPLFSGGAILSISYDNNLNRTPDSTSAPAQHSGKSDLQSLAMVHLKFKPRLKQKKLEFTTSLGAYALEHQDYSRNNLWGVSLNPRISTKTNNDFISSVSLGLPIGVLHFPNEPASTQSIFSYGILANFIMKPLDLNVDEWGDIHWQWSLGKSRNNASTRNSQQLDRRSNLLGLNWSMTLPKAWSIDISHQYDLQKGEQDYLTRKQWAHQFTLKHAIPKHWTSQAHASLGFQLIKNLYPEYFGGSQKEQQQQWKLSMSKGFLKYMTSIDLIQGYKAQTLDPDFLPALQQEISYKKAQVRFQYAF